MAEIIIDIVAAMVGRTCSSILSSMAILGTPWKVNKWNLQITYLERKMIFQTCMIMLHSGKLT